MAIKTYSIDKEIAEKFKQETDDGKTSAKLQELMAEYLGEDLTDRKKPINLIKRNQVTKKRIDLIKEILDQDLFGKTRPQIFTHLRDKGIYSGDSGSHHFKEAMKFLIRHDDIPITTEKDKIQPEQIRCMEKDCDTGFSFKVLYSQDMQCPGCGRRYSI